MRIAAERLAEQLGRGLSPFYLVSGDEPLQIEECCDVIRRAALAAGYEERIVAAVDGGFDWAALQASTQSLSLFATRRLIELRIPTGRPGEAGAKALVELAGGPPGDTVILVVTGKLDKAAREGGWVRALEASGTSVSVAAIDARHLPDWVAERLRARGLDAEPEVIDLLAYHMEGNLLALAQEIDKLALLSGGGVIRASDARDSLADSARFSVYALVDTCLRGEAAAARRILDSLHAEGTEPILVLWALARELRSLAQIATRLAAGQPEAGVLSGVWTSRRPLVQRALRRLRPGQWLALVARAARADRVLKGRLAGDVWFELQILVLALCGLRLPSMAVER